MGELKKLEPAAGRVLISEPFLPDANFSRSVVLLTDHNQEGSMGFVINQPLETDLNEVLENTDLMQRVNLYKGGPVQLNTLHFIHADESMKDGAAEILPGLYYGGDFEQIKIKLSLGLLNLSLYRFFLGYSGWAAGQLNEELQEESWAVSQITVNDLLLADATDIWKKAMTALGGDYAILANAPLNPQWN